MNAWFPRAASDERTYRAYRIAVGGGIVTAEIVSAVDDAHAATIARTLATLYPIELWERARFLGRFEPAAGAAV